MGKKILISHLYLCATILILMTVSVAHCETFPPNIWKFTKDYYDVFGEPELSTSLMGFPEFENGEKSRIFIRLTNEGQVLGFENDNIPTLPNETMDAKKELYLEDDVTTAINIQATLKGNNGVPVSILSGPVQGGFLRRHETSRPMGFDIEIFDNAQSGTYELNLYLTYQYQKDVRVEGYPDENVDYWYVKKNQTPPIYIKVKPNVNFVIDNVRSQLVPGNEGVVFITYKNTGTEAAEGTVADISVTNPFTITDNQEFIGILKPGDSYKAQYRIEVDKTAIPKTYWIETKLEYKDRSDGAIEIVVLKVPMNVDKTLQSGEKVGVTTYFILFSVVLSLCGIYIFRTREKKVIR
ncbi:MAG: COG1361 S-layer family protein [Methanosarcinaceae archaeon]